VLAGAIALSEVGLDLQNFAIVAGALSVGIGFGLQSIVSNFVSGLILLAERPIRVGDIIAVSGEEGFVRRISVRATEIETYDRATLIIPNSQLITGTVKNWVYGNTWSRVRVTLSIGYDADVEAVRAAMLAAAEGDPRIVELWERYRRPLAITEAHLGGAREEQLRWFVEAHQACRAARAAGISVQAITPWALLGSFDWNSLVTRDEGHYEPGAFDVRAPSPRPTALAGLFRDISAGRSPEHPVLAVPGWWRRPERVLYRDPAARVELLSQHCPEKPARPILITGGSGTLGAALGRIAAARGLPYRIVSRREMDIADPRAVERMFAACDPWAVINAAGYVRVDDAESERERCMRENVMGPKILAEACRVFSIHLVTFSSDLVFDGARGRPYVESDRVGPLCVYGLSKAHAEELTLAIHPTSLVIRSAAFFGPWDEHNFVFKAVDELARKGEFFAADDAVVSPTYVPDLANATLDLLIDGESGLWHVANPGAVTWHDLARRSAELAGVDTSGLRGCSWRELDFAATRPAYCALGSERGTLLPPLEVSLERYMNERTPKWPIPGEGAARGRSRCVSS